MKVTNIVNIDLSIRQNIPFVDAVQGDSARAIEFRLFDKGQPFNVPDGSAVLIRYKRPDGFGGVYDTLPNGEIAYSIIANKVTVVLSHTALGVAGNVDFQITVSNGEDLISAFALEIRVDADPSSDVVDAEDYINISQFVTQESKKNAPYIGDNGNWWVNQEDTGVKAGGGSGGGGADGFSPVAKVTQTDSGATITITDKNGTTTATVTNGKDGAKGDPGEKGEQGIQGDKGDTGPQGIPGTAAQVRINPQTQMWEYANEYDAQGNPIWITSDIKASGEKGDPGKDGTNGKDGTSVTVKSVSESAADGGSNVVTFSDGKTVTIKNGTKGSTGGKGDTGATGQRGTGLLSVTTAPSSYTTAVGGITPKYRMALSTIKTQAGVTEVLLGDTVRYSYYQYPIDYLDASYAYFTERISIRGATGADGTTPVKGTDYFTEADKAEMVEDVKNSIPKPLTGKTIAVLGDSISSVAYTVPNYWQLIAQKTGCTFLDYGVSGSCIAVRANSTTSFVERAANMESADAVLVMGGTNDAGKDILLGEWASTDNTNLYGALNALISLLRTKYYDKPIIFCTPIKSMYEKDNGFPKTMADLKSASASTNLELWHCALAIQAKCAVHGIPVIDLYNASGIGSQLSTFFRENDKLHPSELGECRIANMVQPVLEQQFLHTTENAAEPEEPEASYTNLVPTSVDTDGTVYNGTGYKDDTRLSSSGGVSGSAQTGSATTGFMPYSSLGIIRIKGAKWLNSDGHYYINAYDQNKTFTQGIAASDTQSSTVATYNASTGITTIDMSKLSATNVVRKAFETASYIRINAYGKGADLIITVNQEITA